MQRNDGLSIGGVIRPRIVLPHSEAKKIRLSGLADVCERTLEDGRLCITGHRHNAFVDTGLQLALDRLFGLSGPPAAISHMAVSADDAAVVAGTTLIDPAGGDAGSTFVAVSSVSRTGQTVEAHGLYDEGTVAFAINKVGLLNTATDAGTGLVNVIGGAGVSPFNEPFTIDLTGAATWDLDMQLDVTAQAT